MLIPVYGIRSCFWGIRLTASSGSFIFVPQTGFAGIILLLIVSPIPRKKGDISFGRTNLQLALALTTHSELRKLKNSTPRTWNQRQSKLQICSSERNVPLLPVDWKTIRKRMMPANPVCGTNIKAPELAVKGTPQKELRIPWTGINIKIPC